MESNHGCEGECSYCRARDVADRRLPSKFTTALHPSRLHIPSTAKPPSRAETDTGYRNVNTCPMADLFGPWVPQEWIEAVLVEVEKNLAKLGSGDPVGLISVERRCLGLPRDGVVEDLVNDGEVHRRLLVDRHTRLCATKYIASRTRRG